MRYQIVQAFLLRLVAGWLLFGEQAPRPRSGRVQPGRRGSGVTPPGTDAGPGWFNLPRTGSGRRTPRARAAMRPRSGRASPVQSAARPRSSRRGAPRSGRRGAPRSGRRAGPVHGPESGLWRHLDAAGRRCLNEGIFQRFRPLSIRSNHHAHLVEAPGRPARTRVRKGYRRARHPPQRFKTCRDPRRRGPARLGVLPGRRAPDPGRRRDRHHRQRDQRGADLRRHRRDQRRGRQLAAADRLSRRRADADPGLPVQARLRRGPADPQGRDRRGHQLHRRLRVEHRALPGLHQLQRRIQLVADGAGQGAEPRHQAVRSGLGSPGLDQRRLLVHRHHQLPGVLAELRQVPRPDHQLPGRLERARLQHLLVRAAALRPQQQRLLGGADRRRGQRLEHRQRHRLQLHVRQQREHHRRALPLPGR